MASVIVNGNKKLRGQVKLSGNKNSCLKIMAATVSTNGITKLNNVPIIRDVEIMGQILTDLGAKIDGLGTNSLTINTKNINKFEINPELSGRIRASVVLAAPLVARFGEAIVMPPGGDQIGERLLDTHFNLMKELGVEVAKEGKKYHLKYKDMGDRRVFLEEASVTATEMGLIFASSSSAHSTVIQDAACEPSIQELALYLNSSGAKVSGAGTNTIEIKGCKNLHQVEHDIWPDYTEGATYMILGAITGSEITIKNYIPEDYQMILKYLSYMGVRTHPSKNEIKVLPSTLKSTKNKFQTRPWPGFPTDVMSPFIVLATQTQGTVLCHDWMYEWRIFFVDDLISMGARILIADPHRVIITGPSRLTGEHLVSKDIRAGVSSLLAALVAEGESKISDIEVIERGYENLVGKMQALGADITPTNN